MAASGARKTPVTMDADYDVPASGDQAEIISRLKRLEAILTRMEDRAAAAEQRLNPLISMAEQYANSPMMKLQKAFANRAKG